MITGSNAGNTALRQTTADGIVCSRSTHGQQQSERQVYHHSGGRRQTKVCRVELRMGNSVTTTVTTRTVKSLSCSRMRGRVLSPGARGQMGHFYDEVDWMLGEEERELRRKAKKARRKEKRRLRKLLKMAGREASVATNATLPTTAFRCDTDGTRSAYPKFCKHNKRREAAK